MSAVIENYIAERRKYFDTHGWEDNVCPFCGLLYYSKNSTKNCGSYNCNQGYTFFKIGSRRTFFELEEIRKYSQDFFQKFGYEIASPIDIVRINERTLFASAAGQTFDDAIQRKQSPKQTMAFSSQPVIRLQGEALVGKIEGYSTSFINLATDKWNPTPTEHFISLDNWLDFISERGIFAGNLSLKTKSEENDWGVGRIHSETVRFNYRGLELGIANLFSNIPFESQKVTMSDISFGLERLVWSVNKSESYFDTIGPLIYVLHDRNCIPLLDSVRTMALMSGMGVTPAHYDQGGKFRILAKKAAVYFGFAPYDELSKYYHDQWSNFISLKIDSNTSANIMKNEIERNANVELARKFGFKTISRENPSEYLHSLVKQRKIKISDLHKKSLSTNGDTK